MRVDALKVKNWSRLGCRRKRYSCLSGARNSRSGTGYRIIELDAGSEVPIDSASFARNRIVTSKYTVWNFAPKNLFEQFRRLGNFYFLVSALVAVSIESPISPLTTWLPLVFVILVTACKQGYEDLLRYRADRRVNNRPCTVIRRKCSQEISCQQIMVGDLVKVNRDEDVPCDLLLLHSSEAGKCYVTTSNLDGESNLKCLRVPRVVRELDLPRLVSARATIECQAPVAGLYSFEGRIKLINSVDDQRDDDDDDDDDDDGIISPSSSSSSSSSESLGIDNLLLRGSRLKDTDFVIGCAVYTGDDTKLSLNSKLSVNKFSTVEKSINKYLLVFVIFLLLEVLACTAMKAVKEKKEKWDFYLGGSSSFHIGGLANDVLSFAILFNYVVPISLYVTIEMQKFLGALFFGWDAAMYDAATDQPALANTSDLNEDLGQIEYLFSDKTGTLTDNLMIFRRCYVDGASYSERDCDGHLYLLPADGDESKAERTSPWTASVWHFFLGVAICHSVQVASAPQRAKARLKRSEYRESFRSKRITRLNSSLMMDPELPEYEAASADEKALVEAAARCGVVFLGENDVGNDVIDIDAQGTDLRYRRLDTLEFTSDRKRMSVLVEDAAGDIWLYCKGADSALLPLLSSADERQQAMHRVADFSRRGLRTLVLGFRKYGRSEYAQLSAKLKRAREKLGGGDHRLGSVQEAASQLESGLTLLGVSAVEDRLQEAVPETLEKLRRAGLKVWVLTGDQAETAENIASFCGHFRPGIDVLRLINVADSRQCRNHLTSFERKMKLDPVGSYGLLMDGTSIGIALKNHPRLLRSVSMACDAVVGCRMSPLQKSQMVQLVKRARDSPLTAAVGDGGNDVSMIKEAQVGIGIIGREGRQAAMSADFAIHKFQHLERALLVHGHWYYLRIAQLAQYFFYKNLVFITPQLFFAAYNGFSGQALYDSIFLMGFNMVFSSAPILVFGCSEQDFSERRLLAAPELYRLHRKNYLLAWRRFVEWTLVALWQTSVIYFASHAFWRANPVNLYDGTAADHWCFSTCIFHLVTLVINLQLLIESSYWTVPLLASIALTELLFFFCTFVYSFWNLEYDGSMFWVYPKLLLSPSFWLLSLLIVVACLAPVSILGICRAARASRLLRSRRSSYSSSSDDNAATAYSPIDPSSPDLPNRERRSSLIPWRGDFTFYDNLAF
uniref:Phospholipid-transporting ATPase n=1 Tax=Trichogramma kaykai TaxID=54128 RepID=A0ABD2X6E1_9HYME